MRTARDVPTPWACRNTMMSRTAFCSAQPATILPARNSPMPDTSRIRSGSASMTSKVFSPKAATIPLGQHGTDAAHHAGAEVSFDSFRRRRRRGLEEIRLELETVRSVGDPDADGVDEFSRRDRSHMPDDGNEVAFPARLHL